MNKRISNYLKNIEKSKYTFLDKILFYYMSGQFYELLLKNNATEIEFFPSIKKTGNSIQIYFNYFNLSAILEFKEEYYEYCKYQPKCSAEELEYSIIKQQYDDEFDIRVFIINFIDLLNNDKRLIKTKKSNSKKRKKLYSAISIVALFIPWIILGMMILFSYAIKKDFKLNAWFALIVLISIVIWVIFDLKSKK